MQKIALTSYFFKASPKMVGGKIPNSQNIRIRLSAGDYAPYQCLRFGLPSASPSPILSVKRDGKD
jgi:hypothetical protein